MPTRIALISDLHLGYGDNESEQAATRRRIAAAIETINAARVDFLLLGGDLVENPGAEAFQQFQQHLRRAKPLARAVPGNHDVGNRKLPEGRAEESVSAERVTLYEKYFGASFWRERVKGRVRVVAVNASLFGSGLEREAEQWHWLEDELIAPDKKPRIGPVPTILLSHYPLFLEAPDEAEADWNVGLKKSYWTVEPQSRARLLDLFRRGDVRAVFSGHLHHPLVNRHEGVLFVSSPPLTMPLARDEPPGDESFSGWTLITVSDSGEIEHEFCAFPASV